VSYAVWRGGVIVNIIWLASVAALLIWRKEFDWSQPSAKIIFGVCAGLAVLLMVGFLISGG
jgi:putative intracellular protease/amidase